MKGAKIILRAKSPTFRAAKLKGFPVLQNLECGRHVVGHMWSSHP